MSRLSELQVNEGSDSPVPLLSALMEHGQRKALQQTMAQALVSAHTGKVLRLELKSKVCSQCQHRKGCMTQEEFQQWFN